MRELWRTYQHGFLFCVILGFCALLALIYAGIILVPLSFVLDLMGRPEPSESWYRITWVLMLPLSVGFALRRTDLTVLNPDYWESETPSAQ